MKRLLAGGAYRPTELLRRHKKADGRTFARQRSRTAGRLRRARKRTIQDDLQSIERWWFGRRSGAGDLPAGVARRRPLRPQEKLSADLDVRYRPQRHDRFGPGTFGAPAADGDGGGAYARGERHHRGVPSLVGDGGSAAAHRSTPPSRDSGDLLS